MRAYVPKAHKFFIGQVVQDDEGDAYTVRGIAEYQFNETEYHLELITDDEDLEDGYFWAVESDIHQFKG
jgi:hypothetical protein